MADDIDIIDTVLSGPRYTPPGGQQAWYDIDLTLRNNTGQTQYVVAEPRGIAYDAATHTLNLRLSDSQSIAPELERAQMMPHTPKQIAISPGSTEQIRVSVPGVIRRMLPPTGLSLPFESIDISGVEHVSCTIAYNTSPLVPVPSESATEKLRRHGAWGKRVTRTATVRQPKQ